MKATMTPTTPIKKPSYQEESPSKTSTPSTTTSNSDSLTSPEDWYLQGERVWYDPQEKRIAQDDTSCAYQVFHRIVLPQSQGPEPSSPQRWMTLLPSNPEGSYGFHLVEEELACGGKRRKLRCDTDTTSITETCDRESECMVVGQHSKLARLYLDYPGQGDSDTPLSPSNAPAHHDATSSPTKQRADVVEALWEANGIQRTVVVSAGESALVVMELLQRQRQRLNDGIPFPKILHVLALNGRYVAKNRHTSQLATVTQLLRSDTMGPSLAAKAQRSDFYLSQCLQPYLKGSPRHVRRQVAYVVRRNQGASSLVEMARTVDDHVNDRHRYRWHLPHLIKAFTRDQGITWHLVSTNRSAQRQIKLVQEHLEEEYEPSDWAGVMYSNYSSRSGTLPTTSFLLSSSPLQLEALVRDILCLENEAIPMSSESRYQQLLSSDDPVDDSSWNPAEEDMSAVEEEERSVDSRLHTEIVFDASHRDDDDFDLF